MIKKAKQDSWRLCLMPCESMKKNSLVVTSRYKAKLERHIDASKSTQHNRS